MTFVHKLALGVVASLALSLAGRTHAQGITFDFERGADGWTSDIAATPARVVSVGAFGQHGQALELPVIGKEAGIFRKGALDASRSRAVQFNVLLPEKRSEVRLVLCFVDEDDCWYQTWSKLTPTPEKWTTLEIDLRPMSASLRPMGHSRPWGAYAARAIRSMSIRVFSDKPIGGAVQFDNIAFLPMQEQKVPQALMNFETSGTHIPRYGLFEVGFELARSYDNPFDPDQVDLTATFVSPDGRKITVPGFFYQDYERRREKREEILIPVGSPKWKIRFAPTEAGVWTYSIRIRDTDEMTLPARKFTCVKSDSHGYVQVSSDKRYFEFQDGSFFYPIGHNIPAAYNEKAADVLRLPLYKREGTLAFDRFLNGMADAGENYARIWLASWSFGLEWSRNYERAYRDVGAYNLENAWKFDYVLQQAERRNIYVQLALTTWGHFSTSSEEGDWKHSPYNLVNGGWLKTPQQFWTDERAQRMYQRMVRYAAARWGYSQYIAAWEMSNEIDLATGFPQLKDAVAAWHKSCVATLREFDPNPHLVTTNFANWQNSPQLIQLPEISFSSTNKYTSQIIAAMRDQIWPLKSAYGKPAIMAECGYDFVGAGPETTERYLHICLWSSYMIPFGGAGMSWWWDFIDDRNLYWMHKPLVEFAKGEDLRNRNLQMSSATCQKSDGIIIPVLAAMTLQNDSSGYFWVYESQMLRSESDAVFAPSLRAGTQLVFRGLKDGSYTVEFWDTMKGGKVQTVSAESKSGLLTCSIPDFTGDIAGKVKPIAAPTASAPSPELTPTAENGTLPPATQPAPAEAVRPAPAAEK